MTDRERLAQPIIKNYLEKDNLEPQRTHWDGCEEVHPECKKPEQEPLAYLHRQGNYWYIVERHLTDEEKARGWTEEPVYTAPPQRTWVGLTDEEIDAEWLELDGEASAMFKRVIRKFARAVLAKAYKENT